MALCWCSQTDALLAPRFPLYGGWSTDFVFGYSLPLSNFVTKGSDGVRTLRATLGPAVHELVTDNLTVKVRSRGVPIIDIWSLICCLLSRDGLDSRLWEMALISEVP